MALTSPRRFSVYQIIDRLDKAGFWTQIKAQLPGAFFDRFVAAKYFAEDNEYFAKFVESAQALTGWSGDKVEEFLNQCLYTED